MTRTLAVLVVSILAVFQSAMGEIAPSPKNFFPNVKGNLTQIGWAHAVNSIAALNDALAKADILMLEGDVVMGIPTGNARNSTEIPIMAHPPANESDLTLEEFLSKVQNTGKGIKLDFKSINAFDQSKPIIGKFKNDLTMPVFLNADILPGPVDSTVTPVDASRFLNGASATFPESTLSVGWTTRYGKEFNITDGRYTAEQLQKMVKTLADSKVTQPITYPVRAGLIANDTAGMKSLISNSSAFGNVTLTIWSSVGDVVDAKALSKLIKEIGVENVYLDVPKELHDKLDVSAAPIFTPATIMTLCSAVFALLLSRMV